MLQETVSVCLWGKCKKYQ